MTRRRLRMWAIMKRQRARMWVEYWARELFFRWLAWCRRNET